MLLIFICFHEYEYEYECGIVCVSDHDDHDVHDVQHTFWSNDVSDESVVLDVRSSLISLFILINGLILLYGRFLYLKSMIFLGFDTLYDAHS